MVLNKTAEIAGESREVSYVRHIRNHTAANIIKYYRIY